MDGIAASSSVRNVSGVRSHEGLSSERKIAMPSATGVASSNARNEEHSVPQMNGNAPKLPATGSQVDVSQNRRPNARMDSSDSRNSTTAMAPTINTSTSANAPVLV